MELWQVDCMAGVYLSDGVQLSVVTGIDDPSGYCVIAKLVVRATAQPVCDALLGGLSAHGIPEQILKDNGKVFTGKRAKKPSNVNDPGQSVGEDANFDGGPNDRRSSSKLA